MDDPQQKMKRTQVKDIGASTSLTMTAERERQFRDNSDSEVNAGWVDDLLVEIDAWRELFSQERQQRVQAEGERDRLMADMLKLTTPYVSELAYDAMQARAEQANAVIAGHREWLAAVTSPSLVEGIGFALADLDQRLKDVTP